MISVFPRILENYKILAFNMKKLTAFQFSSASYKLIVLLEEERTIMINRFFKYVNDNIEHLGNFFTAHFHTSAVL